MSKHEWKLLRKRDAEWCEARVELAMGRSCECLECKHKWETEDSAVQYCPSCGKGTIAAMPVLWRLAFTGMYGEVVSAEDAEEMALDYWARFLDDEPDELGRLIVRFPEIAMRAAQADPPAELSDTAAAFIVETDGKYHGLDVHLEDGDHVYLVTGCGQCHDMLREWFPELNGYFEYHLNDLSAGCEHQIALSWGKGHDVALARQDCTPVQLDVLDAELAAATARKREKWMDQELARIEKAQRRVRSGRVCHALGVALKGCDEMTTDSVDYLERISGWSIESLSNARGLGRHPVGRKLLDWLFKTAELEYPDEQFRSHVWKDSLRAPCPECGYRYGTAWLRRPLPEGTMSWFLDLEKLK